MSRQVILSSGGCSVLVSWTFSDIPFDVKVYRQECRAASDDESSSDDEGCKSVELSDHELFSFYVNPPALVIKNAFYVHETEGRPGLLVESDGGKVLYCIGSEIYKFAMDCEEHVECFETSTDDALPWVVTNKYVYVVLEDIKIPIDVWGLICDGFYGEGHSLDADPYRICSGPIDTYDKKYKHLIKAYGPFKDYLNSFQCMFQRVL